MSRNNSQWSVRMRASKTAAGKEQRAAYKKTGPQSPTTDPQAIHISGAEGIYAISEVDKIVRAYIARAMNHPKGKPDKVVITVEEMKQKPRFVPLLPITTVQCDSPCDASKIIGELLSAAGISHYAIKRGVHVVAAKAAMHGAALISSETAVRLDPDRQRGVRVSRLGIDGDSEKRLSRKLSRNGINTSTVKEALILASKVASCKDIVAELCMSDDPHYTTGYVAAKELGYIRIPNIKRKGSLFGGRVFYIKEGADVKRIIEYLEKTPVIVGI